SANGNEDLWRDEFDLPFEERPAGESFLRRRRTVSRRPPIDDIGDVNVRLTKADCCKHLVEQLSCAPDERFACEILVAAGRFPDDHKVGAWRTAIEAEFRCRR